MTLQTSPLPDYPRFPAPRDDSTPTERYEAALENYTAAITGDDVIQELCDVEDDLAALARDNDSEAIGAVVVNVMRHYTQRLADREVFGSLCRDTKWADGAALEALQQIVKAGDTVRNGLIRAHLAAKPRRFEK